MLYEQTNQIPNFILIFWNCYFNWLVNTGPYRPTVIVSATRPKINVSIKSILQSTFSKKDCLTTVRTIIQQLYQTCEHICPFMPVYQIQYRTIQKRENAFIFRNLLTSFPQLLLCFSCAPVTRLKKFTTAKNPPPHKNNYPGGKQTFQNPVASQLGFETSSGQALQWL